MPITRRIPQITPIPIHTKTKAAELPSSKESDSAPEAEKTSDGMDVLSVSVKEGVGSGVGSVVGTGVGSGVGSAVGTGVGSSVGTGVGSGVGTGVGSGVGSAVGTGVGSGVGTGVGSGVGTGVGVGSVVVVFSVIYPST